MLLFDIWNPCALPVYFAIADFYRPASTLRYEKPIKDVKDLQSYYSPFNYSMNIIQIVKADQIIDAALVRKSANQTKFFFVND